MKIFFYDGNKMESFTIMQVIKFSAITFHENAIKTIRIELQIRLWMYLCHSLCQFKTMEFEGKKAGKNDRDLKF